MKLKPDAHYVGKSGLFSYLLLLTVFFIALELSFLIQSSEVYFGNFKLVGNKLAIPMRIIPAIAFFIFAQLLLHFLFTVLVWGMARLIGIALALRWKTIEKLGFSLWFLGIATVLLLNQYYYPNSKFSELLSFLFHPQVSVFLLSLLSTMMFFAILISLWGVAKMASRKIKIMVLFVSLSAALGMMWFTSKTVIVADGSTAQKPNIILIGIDSLRPDALGYFGFEKITPNLDNFLNQATVFSNSLTAIARTFPAWMTILTGNYPKQTDIRSNLVDLSDTRYKSNSSLPIILQKKGYQTLFATDEVRFSNIDKSYGFDDTVTPPIGFNDFLLGTVNDFPIANLLINTPVGKILFPYSYANRAVYITYRPNSFLASLRSHLLHSRKKPLFMAIHFCLPHYPYLWQRYGMSHVTVHDYYASVRQADRQFNQFMKLLKQSQLLENTIVIVLSDHGEAIELPGDRITEKDLFIAGAKNKKGIVPSFYPPSVDKEEVNQSAGHGTDVLSLTQSHNLLAVRLYGFGENKIGMIPNKVSLLDIKPTLLDFLGFSSGKKSAGRSLTDAILGRPFALEEKDFFIESDFSPQAIRTVHPETKDVILEGAKYYQVDHLTTRMLVKKDMMQLINSSKQFADVYQGWMLAFYPQNNQKMMPILVNLETGEWTNDLQTAFAQRSPAKHMLFALKKFFKSDLCQ